MIETTKPGRALDALVGEKLMGYRWSTVAKDCDGQNDGKVLLPPSHREGDFYYPPRGPIHPAFHCPQWSERLEDAMALALRCNARGWTLQIERLAGTEHWEVQFGPGKWASHRSLPAAICCAALEALEVSESVVGS